MAEATDSQQPDEDDEQEDRDIAVLHSHVAQLMEHFETVQVFCTRHCPERGGTVTTFRGDGNWFARYGSVREWLVKQEEQMRLDQRPTD